MADRIEIEQRSHDGSFWWRWKAHNGQIVATSETYASASNARREARKAVRKLGCKLLDHTAVRR